MQQCDKLFINGKWMVPHGTGRIDVIHAATEAVMASIPEGSVRDAEDAILAARGAFDAWAATPPTERAAYLRKIAENLKVRSEELAQTIAGEVGMPIKLARTIQVGGPIYTWNQTAKLLEHFRFEEEVGNSLVVREPVGVVAAITPWNYPLHQITLKVAAALAAGCTVVLKPSEVAPLNAFVLAEAIEAARLPPGVFNLVTTWCPSPAPLGPASACRNWRRRRSSASRWNWAASLRRSFLTMPTWPPRLKAPLARAS
jgi:aldehyde dehydrogenase (NAD+)